MRTKARLNSCSGSGASAWILNTDHMHSFAFKLATRLRLGLPHADNLPIRCPACSTDLRQNPAHLLICNKANGLLQTVRHDVIRDLLVSFLQRVGIRAIAEPNYYGALSSKKKVDIDATFPLFDTHLVEVAVMTPTAKTFLKKAQEKQGGAAVREDSKTNKYQKSASAADATFVPFVMESFGTIGKQALKFIDNIVIHAYDVAPDLFSLAALRREIIDSLSTTLQIANAKVIRALLKKLFV